MHFYHLRENIKKQLLDTGLNASKKIVHKAGKYLGNKIANNNNIEKQESFEEIIVPPEKKR